MSAYTKATCIECEQPVMALDGRTVEHFIRGTTVTCDGSGEPGSLGEEIEEPVAREPLQRVPFKIEKGIPIPKVRPGKEGRFRRQLKAMEVGDSFAVPADDKRVTEAAVRDAAKKLGMKVAIRRDGNEFRVWRVQ